MSEDAGGSLSLSLLAAGVVVEFALSGCSELVRSVGALIASGSRILDGEEGTNSAGGAATVWLNRALRWHSVGHRRTQEIKPKLSAHTSVGRSIP